MRRVGWVIALIIASGCGEAPPAADAPVEPAAPAPAARNTEMDEYFVKWLKDHKHTDVVVDADGVGLAGNATRMRASLHAANQDDQGVVAEVEFTIVLPSGRSITEFVGGIGDNEQAAIADAFVNFSLTTVHVAYKGFINANDTHVEAKPVPVNGVDRPVIAGNLMMRGNVAQDQVDLSALRPAILATFNHLPLSPDPHWVKLVFMQQDGQTVTLAVTIDNEESPELTRALSGVNWPQAKGFYMLKQFILIQ